MGLARVRARVGVRARVRVSEALAAIGCVARESRGHERRGAKLAAEAASVIEVSEAGPWLGSGLGSGLKFGFGFGFGFGFRFGFGLGLGWGWGSGSGLGLGLGLA